MEYAPSISQIAILLADPKRSAMIWALIDGSARASEELATLAGLTPSSASAHLARLAAGGLLKLEARGRKRFFKLATPQVGTAVEALASVWAGRPDIPQGLALANLPPAPPSMRKARLCHDHLGGELSADLFQRLLDAGWLEQHDQRLEATQKGVERLASLGIYLQALASHQDQAICACCDWSNSRPHLGGALGASLLRLFLQSGWLRMSDESRVLHVTQAGVREIANMAREVAAPAPV
ncbi:ArsR family transcriptional regulator [Pseudomonas sp. M47T1]|uniref:ArsR/SmtB family transcription factor n=1 Tax=unclassified Pseudomonas TaxID=196821 RepID=UPI000260881B|nr:helix-turn-helix transcriptional regulator [Pseudomonas sp. M47T1]EIK96576.1 ArsR family transcriptional regulator [Pseudomonas sp. M47T1]